MIGRPEISRLSVAGGVSEGAQEKDYVLAWLLAARATLGPSRLVFKGGTALQRFYVPGYRYSEDLDFTADDQADLEDIGVIVDAWCDWVGDHAGIQASRVSPATTRGGSGFLIDVYSVPEIWAEKARSLMQRSEPRDLYDLHQLLEDDPTLPGHAKDLFRRKAIAKSLQPDDLLARLDGRQKTWQRLWQQRLGNQVRDLPDFDGVWRRVIRGLRQADY